MIGIARSVKVPLMARITSGWRRVVIVVCMALRAGQGRVHSCQWVVRIERVVKLGIQPVGRGVAGRAIVRQSELHVRGIVGAGEICRVATEARRGGSLEYVIEVASSARQC